jgi:hypothetical protein
VGSAKGRNEVAIKAMREGMRCMFAILGGKEEIQLQYMKGGRGSDEDITSQEWNVKMKDYHLLCLPSEREDVGRPMVAVLILKIDLSCRAVSKKRDPEESRKTRPLRMIGRIGAMS